MLFMNENKKLQEDITPIFDQKIYDKLVLLSIMTDLNPDQQRLLDQYNSYLNSKINNGTDKGNAKSYATTAGKASLDDQQRGMGNAVLVVSIVIFLGIAAGFILYKL